MENWRPQTALGRSLVLSGAALCLVTVTTPIAAGLHGRSGILAVGVSCVCCLLPGCLLFVLAHRFQSGPAQLNCLLAAPLVRGACCLAGAVVMDGLLQVPQETYLVWLTVFYLAMLGVEVVLLSQGDGSRPRRPGATSTDSARIS